MAVKIGKDPIKTPLPKTTSESKSKGLGVTENSSDVISQKKSNKIDFKQGKNPDVITKRGGKDKLISTRLFNTIDPKVKGGGYDSNGNYVSPKGQLVNAIIQKDNYRDDRPLNVIGDELESAKKFDEELSYEQQKAKALIDPINAVNDIPVEDTYLTTSDIENEYNQTLNGMVEGDPEAENNFYNLSNYLKNSPVKYGEPAIERLGLEEYYPDINTPLQVGNYSGSIVGSNPIFVGGGGYFPFSILDARKRAMEVAAANRVKEGEKIKELMLVDGAEQYQDQLSDIGLNMFNEFGESVGWDYRRLTDMKYPEAREFNKKYHEYRSLAKRTIAIQKQYESVIEEWNTKDKYIPPHIWDLMSSWKSGMYNMEETLNDPSFIMETERQMQSYDNMIKDTQDLKSKIDYNKDFAPDPTKTYTQEELDRFGEEIALIKDASNYDILRTRDFSFVPMDRIIALVDETVDNGKYYDPEQTKIDMTTYLANLLADQIEASYIEAADRSTRVSVSVNNVPPDVSIVKDTYNKASNPAFVSGMDKLLGMGADKGSVDSYFSEQLGVTPISDTPYIDGVIPLGDDAGRQDYLPINEVEVYYEKTGEWLSYGNWSTNTLKDKYGLNESQVASYTNLVNKSDTTQEQLYNYLTGVGISKDDALMFSKGGTSTIFGELSSRDITYGYTDANGGFVPYTHDSDPQANSKTMVFDNYSIYDPSGETAEIYAGLKIRKPHDINLTIPAAGLESQMTEESAALKRGGKHGTAMSENSMEFTGATTGGGTAAPGRKPSGKTKV